MNKAKPILIEFKSALIITFEFRVVVVGAAVVVALLVVVVVVGA